MAVERITLRGSEWRRYYAPVLICVYLVALCVTLTLTGLFLPRRGDMLAMMAAGSFGILMSALVGLLFWVTQRRALEFRVLATGRDAWLNFEHLKAAALGFGWRVAGEEQGRWLQAFTPATLFADGDLVAIECRGREVLLASIPDLDIGFSRQAIRRCREHCDRLAEAAGIAAVR